MIASQEFIIQQLEQQFGSVTLCLKTGTEGGYCEVDGVTPSLRKQLL